ALREEVLKLQSGAEIPLVIHETAPVVASVAEAETRLRAAFAGPLSLYADEASGGAAGPWGASPQNIADMLVITRVTAADGTAGYEVHLNPEQFTSFLNGIAPQLITGPQDA